MACSLKQLQCKAYLLSPILQLVKKLLAFNPKIKVMLELQKFVLTHVREDVQLFKKELIKSILWLDTPDLEKLKEWVWNEFGRTHADVIREVFVRVKASY
jgi:hypothetical protein